MVVIKQWCKSTKTKWQKEKIFESKSYLDESLYLINEKEFMGVYRWLSRELTTVECTRTCEQRVTCDHQSIHNEAVTINREVIANHLAYIHIYLYMFLVADCALRVASALLETYAK